MKVYVTVASLVAASMLVAACEGGSTTEVSAAENAAAASVDDMTTAEADAAERSAADTAADVSVPTGAALANGAPLFASLYPDAVLSKPVLNATEAGMHGGMAEFTTDATAEDVVTYYRQLAESEGLAMVMEMNQGHARAIGARGHEGSELQVVAAPMEDGNTSVQLTWQAARS